MDVGWCYQYDKVSYPRYRYYQQRLVSLLPRWRRIIEAGRLPDCISQGREKLKKITNSVSCLNNKITVNLFGYPKLLEATETKLSIHKDKAYSKKTSITLDSYLLQVQHLSEDGETLATSVVVLVTTSTHYDADIKFLESKFSHLHAGQLENFIISVADTKSNYLYTDLMNKNLDSTKMSLLQGDEEGSKLLAKQIQHILEKKTVSLLEQVVDYIKVFIPKPPVDPKSSLENAIFLKLLKSLKDPFVIKDLSPFPKEGTDLKERMDKASREMTSDERNAKFHDNLLEFVAKKSKCVAVDSLSEKYGISSSLMNKFLNDGHYGYEKKVTDVVKQLGLPNWPSDKSDNGVRTCRSVSKKIAYSLIPAIKGTEDYIKEKHQLLVLVKRLQFELFGLLKLTNVPLDTVIPNIPTLPQDLQSAILHLPDVYGCGTIFGELVLHVTKLLTPTMEKDVTHILKQYGYKHPFSYQLVEPCREQPGGYVTVEHGISIRAKKLPYDNNAAEGSVDVRGTAAEDAGHQYGTLGCFVKIKPDQDERSEKLHAVTCAHCVIDCQQEVEARQQLDYIPLGVKRYYIYEPEALDVATVEADAEKVKCKTGLKDFSGELPFFSEWRFFDGTPLGLNVYKYGSVSNFTSGVCVSVDYQTKHIHTFNEILRQAQCPLLDPFYNILISPRGDIKEETEANTESAAAAAAQRPTESHGDASNERFSEDGDSGSVVCEDDINTGGVMVISLLHGAIYEPKDTKSRKPAKFLYSYTSNILKTVRKLEERHNIRIIPATD